MSKIIIYSALFAEYDIDIEHVGNFCEKTKNYDNVEFVAFTNRKEITSKKWNIKYVKIEESSARLNARYYKMNPDLVLPDHDFSIWMDSQFYITRDPKEIINERLIQAQASIAIHHHGDINNLVREAVSQAFVYKNDNPKICMDQLVEYYQKGFPVLGYEHFETGVLIRINNNRSREFNKMWWENIKKYSLRDQISCPYIVWQFRKKYKNSINTIAESFVAHNHTLNIPKSKDFFTTPKPPLREDINKRNY